MLAASSIAQALTGYGIAVLRFDFTGLDGSGGDFANTNFTSNVAVLAAVEHLPEARAVVTIGAPAGTEHLLHLIGGSRRQIEETGEAEVCLAARPFRIRKQFLEDISDQPRVERIRRLDASPLVMHSLPPRR